ncbi:MAG: murein biosynthesis integral membrane protein MurJ [Raoultibacter sp.]
MSESDNSILKNTGIMTAATLLSRMTGLIRTWAMAFAIGNTVLTSAYQIAYNMPSMIYELAASGILGTAFLPLYLLSKEQRGKEGADDFSSNILSIVLVGLGALALAGSFFAPEVIATQTFTVQNSESQELAIFFFRIFSIQILLYGLGAVITSILNAERVFVVPSLAPVLNNIIVIITMFGYVPISHLDPSFAMWWLAVGTSFGVLIQFGAQIPVLIKHGFHYRPHINFHDPMLKEAIKIALPTFVYVVGTMVTFSCRNAFGLQASANGPSTLNYAWTWYQLPYGVVAVSLSTVLLTELSECAAKENWRGFKHHVTDGLRKTFFLIIPLAAMVGSLATPLMQLFQAGAFNAQDVTSVAIILALWTLSLPFYAGYMYMYRVFASMRKFMTFALVDLALRTIQIAGYWFLCSQDAIGLIGIPLADLLFYGMMMVATTIIVQKHIGGFGVPSILSLFIRVGIASTAGGAAAIALGAGFDIALAPLSFIPAMARGLLDIIVAGSLGLVVTFLLCKVFRVPEFAMLSTIFHKIGGLVFRKKADRSQQVENDAAPEQTDSVDALESAFRGKHARLPQDSNDILPPQNRVLSADETGAIMLRAKHSALGSNAIRPSNEATSPQPSTARPDETGAIMKRARHVR